jgi:hypothetical protein
LNGWIASKLVGKSHGTSKDGSVPRSTKDGMEMGSSDEQPVKTDGSILRRLEFGSKVTMRSDAQDPKQDPPMTSTEDGIQIDSSDEQASNACEPISRRCEFDSKSTLSREVQDEKQE